MYGVNEDPRHLQQLCTPTQMQRRPAVYLYLVGIFTDYVQWSDWRVYYSERDLINRVL